MALPLSQFPAEIIREVRARKWLAFMLFTGVSFVVLAAGFLWPYKYSSEVIIFVDDQNIIRPLMEGSAVTTQINERASAAQELLWSRKVLETVATDPRIYGESATLLTPEELEGRIGLLRSRLSVATRGDSYFSIGYSSPSPLIAFTVAQRLGQAFIEENNERKRTESREAYEFIDKQVRSYEQQIAEVEERLKQFLSENVDGTEVEANARMANLRSQLELAQLDKAELVTRAQSLEIELSKVRPTILQGRARDIFQERIHSLEEQLDELRLQYHDTYPDIVILQEQLSELRRQQQRAAADPDQAARTLDGETIANPVHQQIRSALATTRADIETAETRIRSLRALMIDQTQRMERIQENKAQYSDLTRDMEVNREIYDDLLKRREKARVSMHLDIEGQGLNYRINEAAQYPLSPAGVKFPMFAIAGILLGLLAPFGAAAGVLQLDPRIRSREHLEEEMELLVLETIPYIRTPFERRKDRRTTTIVGFCVIVVAVIYIAVAITAFLEVY